MTLVFFAIVALMALASRLILKIWKPCYFIGGLIVGLFIEIYFEFSWTYTVTLQPFVWRDIPIVVIIGWGSISLLGLSLSDRISANIKSRKTSFIIDISVLYVMLLLNETIMSALNYWTYNNNIHPNVFAQLTGFIFLAMIITSVSRQVDKLLSNNKMESKKI